MEFDNGDFFQTSEKPNLNQEFDSDWDSFTTDDDINWDKIFGKNEDLNTIEVFLDKLNR